jgi:multicomponent K+:H+ antiporter subunit A
MLILLGAFTKSAQFPFHFWLPHAMAAPTPVSAYLHSATMVKAGMFLMARLWPVLAGTSGMVLPRRHHRACDHAGRREDRAFQGRPEGAAGLFHRQPPRPDHHAAGLRHAPRPAVAAMFHILNHATFKAALFMTAGIVDHEAGTPRHAPPGRPAHADADHLCHRRPRLAVDGGHPAPERVPVQGDDAGGSRPCRT